MYSINWNEYEFINELYNKLHDRYVVSYKKNWVYGRVFRSQWVRMIAKNQEVPKWYVIHHIDKNRHNDIVENIELLTRWEHNKRHADDENHYMFREWHTYRNHKKSEEHKQKIKEAHIDRSNKERDRCYGILRLAIIDNPQIKCKKCEEICWKKSHKFIQRLFKKSFKSLKKEILWKMER